jgi:hypothetical protein
LLDDAANSAVSKRSRTICADDDAIFTANTLDGRHVGGLSNRRFSCLPGAYLPQSSKSAEKAKSLKILARPKRFERVTFAFGGQPTMVKEQGHCAVNSEFINGRDLLKRRIGKCGEYFRFAGVEPSCLIRPQHQLQPQLNQFVISVNCKGLVTLAVSPMPFDCRFSTGESKMMEEAKGFVGESQAFQDIKKPDGFFGVHALLGQFAA